MYALKHHDGSVYFLISLLCSLGGGEVGKQKGKNQVAIELYYCVMLSHGSLT